MSETESNWSIPIRAPKSWADLRGWFTAAYRIGLLCSVWGVKVAIVAKLDERYASVSALKVHMDADIEDGKQLKLVVDGHSQRISRLEGESSQRKSDNWYERPHGNQGNINP